MFFILRMVKKAAKLLRRLTIEELQLFTEILAYYNNSFAESLNIGVFHHNQSKFVKSLKNDAFKGKNEL